MPAPPPLPSRRDRQYPARALACLAASLLVVNAAFWLWPTADASEARRGPVVSAEEQIELELVEVTRQTAPAVAPEAPPPPPDVTLPPVEVPDERVIEEVVLDVPIVPVPPPLAIPDAPAPTGPVGPPAPPAPPGPPPPAPPGRAPASDRIVERPQRSPRTVRTVLPAYPPEARREGIRARAQVRVLVSETGAVLDAEVVERVLLDGRDAEQPVASLPFGMEDAALEAARRHLFRAAQDGGERVRAYALISLSFDPPRGG